MRMTKEDREFFYSCMEPLLSNEQVLKMKDLAHHGRISCLDHCISVAMVSYWLCRKLHLHADMNSLVRGALLHDFFLYDWRYEKNRPGLHGFSHPKTAAENAERTFHINRTERDIIVKHMFPLTLTPPMHRESYLVCLADKYCCIRELIVSMKKNPRPLAIRVR